MIEILNENEETEIIGGTIPVQAFATNIEVNPGISSYISETDPIFKASAAYNITNSDIISWNNKASEGYVDTKLMTKQDTLVSGTNIKTINNESILCSGNIEIEGVTNYNELENKPKINNVELSGNKSLTDLGIDLSSKQDILVSGTNIKTINNESILGSGNIEIGGSDINVNNSYSTSQTDTYSCNYVNEAVEEVYSNTEQIIGKWVDNKPIYRKVIRFTTPAGGSRSLSIPEGPSNISEVINCYIQTTQSGDDYVVNGNTAQFECSYAKNGKNIWFNTLNSAYCNRAGILILEYTKTTDWEYI